MYDLHYTIKENQRRGTREKIEQFTPPLDEFGEIRGMSMSNTTTAKSWKQMEDQCQELTHKGNGIQETKKKIARS